MGLNIAELKSCLKELGMSQTGDKGTLEHRIAKGNESVKLGLKTPDGCLVHILKIAKLKKYAAKAGVSPIGTLDEIMFAYIDFLKKNNSPSDTSGAQTGASSSTGGRPNADQLSNKVLQLAQEDDFIGILSLGGANLTASSSVAVLRKAYLKLSLVLHPDKNRSSPDATKVFQALVNAFERISQPELVEEVEVKKGKKKAAAISRSNTGCRRTRICCPRCKTPWSESSVEGNPEYFYNFMMTGIKAFNCATCLLEFGCMTALHYCPFCKHSLEYHPSDYHRQITCGRKGCDKKFGFYLFHCSDRVLKNLKIEVKQLREDRAKETEQKKRRAESFRRRRKGHDDADAEAAFLMGLANECPRCGMSLADLDDEDEIAHLRNCNDDDGKITANKRKKEAIEQKQSKKKKQEELQDDVAAKATWDFLGGSAQDMWLLTDGALQKECAEQGIATKGEDKHEMIARLVGKSQALTKFTGSKGSLKVTAESLPSNLHSMTVSQLKAVAASHGIVVGSKLRKIDIIELLQSKQDGQSKRDGPLMLTDGGSRTGKSRASKDEVVEIESGSDSEYEDKIIEIESDSDSDFEDED